MVIKKKLRDITRKEYKKWKLEVCNPFTKCDTCPFNSANCNAIDNNSWINNKDLFSDKFLNQELETKAPDILNKQEKKYLGNVIKPFKDRVRCIFKDTGLDFSCTEYIVIIINSIENSICISTENIAFPMFKKGTMYKNMEIGKKYTLEELGLFLKEE